MIEEEKIRKAKEKNRKIYPIYKMFAWDLLFYYSITFLFMHQTKGLTASNIFLGNAFYSVFKIIFQPFAPMIINITGKRKAIIIGNIFVSLSILAMILLEGTVINYIIVNLIMAIGYILKGICESCLLEENIPDDENRRSKFSKIDGRGSSYFYIFAAISYVATGFLFVINPYVPMSLCFIFCIVATLLSFKFEHYEVKEEKVKYEHPIKTLSKRISLARQEYIFILKSKRLHALLLFAMLFKGVLNIRSTITSSIFVDIGIPNEYFGIITAVLTTFSAIATWKQHFFHKKFRNKLLTFFALTYSLSSILIGLTIIINVNYSLMLVTILFMMTLQNIIKGLYYTLIKRYLNSFSNEHLSVKIYSVYTFMEELGATLMSLGVSILLEYTTTSYVSLIIGVISLILFIGILDFMKTRIGLKPEEYRKQDIEFVPKEKKEENVVEIAVGIDEKGENNIEIKM